MTIPDSYREWARAKAEEMYAIVDFSDELATDDPHIAQSKMLIEACVAALLSMYPAVEALQHLPIDAFKEDGEGADAADFPDNARHFVAAMDAARKVFDDLNIPTP